MCVQQRGGRAEAGAAFLSSRVTAARGPEHWSGWMEAIELSSTAPGRGAGVHGGTRRRRGEIRTRSRAERRIAAKAGVAGAIRSSIATLEGAIGRLHCLTRRRQRRTRCRPRLPVDPHAFALLSALARGRRNASIRRPRLIRAYRQRDGASGRTEHAIPSRRLLSLRSVVFARTFVSTSLLH